MIGALVALPIALIGIQRRWPTGLWALSYLLVAGIINMSMYGLQP